MSITIFLKILEKVNLTGNIPSKILSDSSRLSSQKIAGPPAMQRGSNGNISLPLSTISSISCSSHTGPHIAPNSTVEMDTSRAASRPSSVIYLENSSTQICTKQRDDKSKSTSQNQEMTMKIESASGVYGACKMNET